MLEARFQRDGDSLGSSGRLSLLVDDEVVGVSQLAQTVPWRMSYVEGLNVGADTGTPVSDDYSVPFRFTGVLRRVDVELSP